MLIEVIEIWSNLGWFGMQPNYRFPVYNLKNLEKYATIFVKARSEGSWLNHLNSKD